MSMLMLIMKLIGGVHGIYVESVDVDIYREVDNIGCVYGVHVYGVGDYVGNCEKVKECP